MPLLSISSLREAGNLGAERRAPFSAAYLTHGNVRRALFSGSPLPARAWAHLALSFDGARLRLYANGELVGTEAIASPDFGSAGAITIGCSALFGSHFKGRIDEVRLYNRALDEGEILNDRGTGLEAAPSGPVAAYAFEEGEGESAEDATGNEHTATLEGPSWTTHGRYGGGLEFSAAQGDKATIAASPQLDFAEEFTLEAWVRPSTAENKYAPLIVHQANGSEAQPYFLYEGSWEPDLPYGGLEANTPQESYSHAKEPLPQQAWSHVALTFDGARTRLYINGALVDEDAGTPPTVSEGNLEIGGASEVDSYFDGRIDEVRLYDRALSEGEIQASKSAPIQTPQRGPVAAYSFDEGEGSTVEDLTGGGHTGTIAGAEWTGRGRYGSALQFDGGTDCVKVPATEDLQFTEEFTLEAWVRPVGSEEEGLPVISMADENSPGEEETFAYELLAGQNEKPKAWVRKGGESGFRGVYGEEPLPQKAWSHIALTDDGAHIRLYVDGKLGTEESSTNVAPLLTTAAGPLEIGCGPVNGSFKGRIDEVRLYNRALSEGELLETVHASFPTATTQPTEEVDANYAIMLGEADANSDNAEFFFEYGLTKSYGMTVEGEEIDGNDEETKVSEAAINLAPETEYHYRLVVNSPVGTAYGKDKTLITGKRTKTAEEEAELSKAEGNMELAPSEVAAGPGDFYGMMWTGDLKKMNAQNIWEAVERSGAKAVRFAIYPDPERQPEIAKAFEEAAKRNLIIVPYFGSGPFPKPGSTKANNWYLYAKKMIEEYGPDSAYKVGTWEIWNEPNMSHHKEVNDAAQEQGGGRHPEEFGEFFRAMAETLKNNSEGDVDVLTPGLYGYRSNGCRPQCHLTPRRFLERMDSVNAYDGISLHPYVPTIGKPGEKHAPKTKGEVLRNAAAIKRVITDAAAFGKGKPLWITELGFPVANPGGDMAKVPPVRKPVQAELVQAAFSMMQNSRRELNIEHAFYYDIQDDEKLGWEYHSGLLEVSSHIRPAWNAYKNLAGGKKCPHEAVPC